MAPKSIKEFSQKTGLSFRNINILREALTHRSYLNENPEADWHHNERLEFLGDAVLELITTDYLFKRLPNYPEGVLTNLRAALVNSQSLAKVAEKLNLEKYILLSRGEKKNNSLRGHQYILGNAIEALIGAIYLDSGYKEAQKFIEEHILNNLHEILETESWKDPKSLFQEEAQAKIGVTPIYKIIKEWGPDHAKQFVMGVFLNEELVAEGQGESKQEAETDAAKKATEVKRKQGWQRQN